MGFLQGTHALLVVPAEPIRRGKIAKSGVGKKNKRENLRAKRKGAHGFFWRKPLRLHRPVRSQEIGRPTSAAGARCFQQNSFLTGEPEKGGKKKENGLKSMLSH